MSNTTFYRVCNHETLQGLWYAFNGEFTGLIHDEFSFCLNNKLEMEFDPELVGWLSATDSLESLYNWFTVEDILKLQDRGWFIHEFEAQDHKFYDRFQHIVINQETSKVKRVICLPIERTFNSDEVKELIREHLQKAADNVKHNHKAYDTDFKINKQSITGIEIVIPE